jgi:hypothetical protein
MMAIIRSMPLADGRDLTIQGRSYRPGRRRAVVSVSIAEVGTTGPGPSRPVFPAVIDTGFNGAFALRLEHLTKWAGYDLRSFTRLGFANSTRGFIERVGANIWLYRNVRGSRELVRNNPLLIEIDGGIQVLLPPPPGAVDARPEEPLIGMRALITNQLELRVDGKRRQFSLYCRRKWWNRR